jgi:predicted transcriptional regulator
MANLKLLYPQEIEVLYILPAIRREIAVEMKKKGFEQKKIAKYLSVTEAAVSQYMKSKRASSVTFDAEILQQIRNSVSKIKDQDSMLKEMQKILRFMKEKGLTCKVHKEFANMPDECKVCKC